MTDINLFVNMAQAESEMDEFSDLQGLPEEMKDLLQEEMAAQKKVQMTQAVKQIVRLLKAAKEAKECAVSCIRNARLAEKYELARIKKIERAQAYATETGNYLPLIMLIDGSVVRNASAPRLNQAKLVVPDDWQPAETKQSQTITKPKVVKKQ